MKTSKIAYIKSYALKYLLLFISVIIFQSTYSQAQARLVINNASFININNGSFLVIDNSANDAITRIGTTGWIISEGTIGNNRVKWKVSNNPDVFTVPFGRGITSYLPLSVTTSGAVGSGSIIFSTFRSGVNSASLPTAGAVIPQTMFPTNYNSGGNDNSAFGVDRFYQIDATDALFTAQPALSDIIFSYADAEEDNSITANTITEGNLQAQYWDNTATNWKPNAPIGTVNTASNIVTVGSHSAILLASSKWWTLVDNSSPLPITLLEFTGECLNKTVEIKWSTLSEINNASFILEKSNNGHLFLEVITVEGSGTTNTLHSYSFIDESDNKSTVYYRLIQIDFDGKSTTSPIIAVGKCNENLQHLSTDAYFNISQQNIQVFINSDTPSNFSITIHNITGSIVGFKEIISYIGETQIVFDGLNLPEGVYMVVIRNYELRFSHKVIINNP
jgi:hypothetical protein